jgi:hypothetical protein
MRLAKRQHPGSAGSCQASEKRLARPSGRVVISATCSSVEFFHHTGGDLTLTEQDIIPATTIDTQGNTVLTNALKAALAASAQFDGTASALDLYVNAAVLNASTTKAVTVAITGTLTLFWINLGDY